MGDGRVLFLEYYTANSPNPNDMVIADEAEKSQAYLSDLGLMNGEPFPECIRSFEADKVRAVADDALDVSGYRQIRLCFGLFDGKPIAGCVCSKLYVVTDI